MAANGLKVTLEEHQRLRRAEFEVLKAHNAEIVRDIEGLQQQIARNVVRMHELRGAFELIVTLQAVTAGEPPTT